MLSRCEALPTERDKAAFGAKNLEQDLSRLLRDATIEQHRSVLDRPLAKSALAGEGRPPKQLNGSQRAACQLERKLHCRTLHRLSCTGRQCCCYRR